MIKSALSPSVTDQVPPLSPYGTRYPVWYTQDPARGSPEENPPQQPGYTQSPPQQPAYTQSPPQQPAYTHSPPQQPSYTQGPSQQSGYTQSTSQQSSYAQGSVKVPSYAPLEGPTLPRSQGAPEQPGNTSDTPGSTHQPLYVLGHSESPKSPLQSYGSSSTEMSNNAHGSPEQSDPGSPSPGYSQGSQSPHDDPSSQAEYDPALSLSDAVPPSYFTAYPAQ